MIGRYLTELRRELAARGVRGRAADRVLTEARDHLLELESIERFGPSEQIAREVAAELATTRTIRSAYGAFVALALTAATYLGFMALAGQPDFFSARHEAFGVAATVGLVLFPQVAFVAGCLALLRAFRRRASTHEELGVIRARARIALGAGALTAVSMAVWIVEFRQSAWLLVFPLLATPLLAVAAVVVGRAGEPHAPAGNPPGDVFDDLGFRMDPWPFAVLFAVFVGALSLVGGWVAEGDPGSGFIRGTFEAAAVLACFAALGRRLALRR